MKNSAKLLPILLIVLLCLAWFSFVSGNLEEVAAYRACLGNAEKSVEAGLYEQAVEYYKQSLQHEMRESVYEKVQEIYERLYEEEHTAFIRNLFIDDMAMAAEAFPKNEAFWTKQVELYMESDNYKKAYSTINKAFNKGADGESLRELYNSLLYMVKPDYRMYTAFKTALNGYITVFDGTNWAVLDETGEMLTSNYRFIGLINDDGKGLYTNNIDTRFLDLTEVPRARFDMEVEEAGYYNGNCDRMPVKIGGVWRYMDLAGNFLPGEYEAAGSFYGSQAAAKTQDGWVLVNVAGEQTELSGIEDIKLDLYGCHIQNGVIIAKENGKYRLYDTNFQQIGTFEADDMDICIDPDRIAFCSGGKWGFINSKGEIIAEPQFAKAKSFANKYAAVQNEEGLWGFINRDFELVIGFQYLDAYYFTQAETCMISTTEGVYQMMGFLFD